MTPAVDRPLHAGTGRAPGLVVLGSPRCGTTSLATWLADAGLGVGVKDSFYLMDDDAGLRGPTHVSTHGIEGYLRLFPESPAPTIECTAGYVYQRRAREFFGSWAEPPHFVLVARDPVERLRSVHRYFVGNLGVLPRDLGFDEYVEALFAGTVAAPDRTVSDALAQGRYAQVLRPWVDAFGHDRVDVVTFDDLRATPAKVVRRLADLVGGTVTADLDAYTFSPRNASYLPRSQVLTWSTSVARRVVPDGRLRAWGGERLRRLQLRRERSAEPDSEQTVPASDTEAVRERLQGYYEESNEELAEQFGVSTTGWA
jgi:hypothetical protein